MQVRRINMTVARENEEKQRNMIRMCYGTTALNAVVVVIFIV